MCRPAAPPKDECHFGDLRGKPSNTFPAATKRPLTKIVNKQSLKHDIRWPKCKPPRAPAQLLNASANPPRQRVAAPTCLRFSNPRSVSQGSRPAPLEGPRKRISMIWCLHCHWQGASQGSIETPQMEARTPRGWIRCGDQGLGTNGDVLAIQYHPILRCDNLDSMAFQGSRNPSLLA